MAHLQGSISCADTKIEVFLKNANSHSHFLVAQRWPKKSNIKWTFIPLQTLLYMSLYTYLPLCVPFFLYSYIYMHILANCQRRTRRMRNMHRTPPKESLGGKSL